jgi:LacI family transcriptional regulator
MNLHDDVAAEKITRQLLESETSPTAIFSSQNLVTVGAIRALRALGLHHKVALVGFDDLPMGDMLEPGVSVVAQDPHQIGTLAAHRLFERLDGNTEAPRTYIVPTRLISRGSGEIRPTES